MSPRVGTPLYLAAARGTSAVLGVVQISLLARFLSPASLTAVAATLALGAYLALIAEPALLGYERLSSHNHAGEDSRTGPRAAAYTLLCGFYLLLPLACAIVGVINGQILLLLASGVWAASLVQLRWVSIQYLNWGEQRKFATAVLANSVGRVPAMAIAAAVTQDAAWTLLIGSVSSIVATRLVAPRSPELSVIREPAVGVLRIGLPLALALAAGVSTSSAPTIIGARLLAVDTFASYVAQVALIAGLSGSTLGYVLVFGFPQAKREWDSEHPDQMIEVVRRYLRYVASMGIALVVLMWLGGAWITALLLGSQYSSQTIPTFVAATATITGLAIVIAWVLRVQFHQNRYAAISLIFAAIQIPLVWWATSNFGLSGLMLACLGVSVGQTLSLGIWRVRVVGASPLAMLTVMTVIGVVVSLRV